MAKIDFHIISAFPQITQSYFADSIIKRAQAGKKIVIKAHNLRDFTTDKHRSVDDTPYGGGVGMVLKVEPIYKAWKSIRKKKNSRTILLSASGQKLTQSRVKELAQVSQIILIAGHYEGVDARVKNFIDEEISIGDYVLTGGELGAAVIIDAVTRLIPGVLGKYESTADESHSRPGVLEYPHYTRPEVFKPDRKTEWKVPKILLGGHHAEIKKWRDDHR
ncbi:MAG: tRNA (guanosine(37)-N1)-methyltransferase TrmD [Candidatus Komeilibacteria bacterium]|nr:tRNA (guanosine(37)-N1)-methyltransferase TrmD [Candidatus Komeilibacteria bacterium]